MFVNHYKKLYKKTLYFVLQYSRHQNKVTMFLMNILSALIYYFIETNGTKLKNTTCLYMMTIRILIS